MSTITHTHNFTTHTYEVVDEVPLGYMIWNIGHCAPEGYLPLCRPAWQNNDSNLNVIAKKVGYSSLSGMSPGDKIIAEPIYWIAGLMGEEVFLTPSELAAFGKDKLGGTSTGWPSNASGNGAGTFGFIRRYAKQML